MNENPRHPATPLHEPGGRASPVWLPRRGRAAGPGLVFLAAGWAGLFLFEPLPAQTTLIQAERVFMGTSEGIVGPRFIVLREGRISSVTADRPRGLPSSAEVVRAAFAAPGFIDARTTLGLTGLHPADDDRDETSGPNQAHLRAIDAFDPDDSMVAHALRGGVTTVQSGPGDANSIGGQAAIFKLGTGTVAEATLRAPSGVVFSLDESAKLTYGQANRYPSTRMANVGLIRQALLDADRYRSEVAEERAPVRDLKKEALVQVLDGEVPALVSAERADELATALRLAEEFGFDLRIVGATAAATLLEQMAEAGVPLLLAPPGEATQAEGKDALLGTAGRLKERGIPFALVTGDDEEAARWSLMDWARAAVRGGLSPANALEAITVSPARILGLEGELGSIEAGKAGDLVLFDGDPMDATTHVQAVYVAGVAVYGRGS